MPIDLSFDSLCDIYLKWNNSRLVMEFVNFIELISAIWYTLDNSTRLVNIFVW